MEKLIKIFIGLTKFKLKPEITIMSVCYILYCSFVRNSYNTIGVRRSTARAI